MSHSVEEVEFAALVALSEQQKVVYVLEWNLEDEVDGTAEMFALVVMKRAGGLLAAVPVGVIPAEVLGEGQLPNPGLVGPSTVLTVPGVLDENGVESPIGTDLQVLVVDLDASVGPQFRVAGDSETLAHRYADDDPYATPEASTLLAMAMSWVRTLTHHPWQDEGFYSADPGPDVMPEPMSPAGRQRARQRAPGGATPSEPKAPGTPKQKRPTTASLQQSLNAVMETLPELTRNMQSLVQRQEALEKQVHSVPSVSRSLAQPLAAQLPASTSLAPVSLLAQRLDPPPKTVVKPNLQAVADTPVELQELEMDKGTDQRSDLARAMLAQSAALTTLVAQLTNSSQDPMADLQLPGSSGNRGSSGRARLQAELASHRGLFFDSMMRSMSRRMAPTSPAERTTQELLTAGITGTKYLERFGGYGRHKELGMIQFQIMTAVDYCMAENYGAVRDTLALLAVCVEQAVLDSGRFEVAQILTLQEDIPASVFTNRQLSSTSRARAFAPLSDPRWVTTAIAFLKELDTITTKRTELLNTASPAPSNPGGGGPNPKPKPKRKGGGRGGRQQPAQAEEEEQ